uniref:NADH-ubiquinone oxidoreductase chain 4 n=1 Tax=Cicadellidae gen. sp. 1 JCX-2018 TaxID=2306300 RepID=A0A346RNJ4_9HEMI|nr:NADH dehydrogenase subunit 4 [Cicadellidae gen. sp. 1 JCX-2018]
MMSYLVYIIFMIPLFLFYKNLYGFFQFILMFYLMIFCFVNINMFYSNLSFGLGLDLFSYGLIILSLVISSLMLISMSYIKFSLFMGFYLFLSFFLLFFLLMIFFSLSLIYMYIYFEFSLLPLMCIILGWGYQPERLIAGMYLFMYTLFSSLPFFVFLLVLNFKVGSMFFDLLSFFNMGLIYYFMMILLFLMKFPMFIFHFWLPKAHVQAPISGSMMLAGVILKVGGYGMIRLMYLFEYYYFYYSYIWYSMVIYGSLIVGMICLVQGDLKMLIAYSSISHMGLCLLGLLSMSMYGLYGSFYLMLGHGFCSSVLFYFAHIFYVRSMSRSFFINSGICMYLPSCSMFMFMFSCFNMSCPPSVNFLSEIFILNSMISYWFNSFYYFFFISLFCSCFSYYLYQFTYHGLSHFFYSFNMVSVLDYLCLSIHLFFIIFSYLMFLF